MGLVLSVLVVCVGVAELIAFFHNVKRNLVCPPVRTDLTPIGMRYVDELKSVRRQILGDLQYLQNESLTSSRLPALRLNSHEDIELEYCEGVRRSRSPSPKRFLVTEKETAANRDAPRRFVLSEEEPGVISKSKSQDSIPEFLIKEQKNIEKSPHKPRYVLREQQGRSESPIPLPRQFIVTEDELNTVVFENTDFEVSVPEEDIFRRSPSPYPPLELPHAPRNSICEVADIAEEDEDICRSISPIPSEKIDVILQNTSHNTTEYWTNKILVQPPGSQKTKSKSQRVRSKSESAEESLGSSYADGDTEEPVVDEKYLNSLDGVDKVKSASRRSFKKKNSAENKDSNVQDQSTTGVLTHAAEQLRNVSLSGDKSALECSEGPEQKPGEPFWLIFSGEYTKAMNKDWHGQHFCCWQCDESLTGQRYVLRDDHPYCVSCYESVFANACEKCSRTIGIDSKDLSYKDKHWHEACFLCTTCGESLVDKQFGSKGDRIYCGSCYDQQFASRCDGCHEIFRAGTKKMEYKTRQWHEKCFCCCMCKVPIGTQSFIPREQEIFCAKCYEEKFATRCIKCNKVITSGGVTYKNEPWHRECFTCTHCEKSLAGERFTSRDDKPYCAECFGELFAKRCTACSRPITGIGGTKFISFEDRHWHNDCFFCATCRTSLVGRGFITDQEDIICPECAKQKLM